MRNCRMGKKYFQIHKSNCAKEFLSHWPSLDPVGAINCRKQNGQGMSVMSPKVAEIDRE